MSPYLPFVRALATSAMLVSSAPTPAATNETPPDLSSLVATWTAPPPSFPGNSRCSTGAVLLGNGSMAACLGGPADKLRLYLARNDFWRLSNSTAGMQKLAAVLDLQVPGLAGASYRIDQTIRDGTLRGVFTKGSLTVRLSGWLAATDDLLVIELLAEGGETSVDVTLTSPGEPPSRTESGVQDATAWVTRKFSEQVEIPTEAATALRLFGAAALRFDLKPGAPVTMAVATTSAFREPKPLDAAKNRVTSLNAAAIQHVRAAHERWWQDYWNRSWVELPDPDLMKGYYQGLYTLAACSRDPKFPP